MPLLDDQVLDSLLHEAGDSFAIPPSGAADILGRVHGDDATSTAEPAGIDNAVPMRVSRTIRAGVRSRPVFAAVASLVLLAIASGGVLLFGTTTPKPATNAAAKVAGAKVAGAKVAGAKATTPATHGVTNGSTGSTRSGATAAAPSTSSGSSAFSTAGAPASSSTSNQSASNQSASAALPASVGQPARIAQTGSLDIEVARGALSATVTRLTTLVGTYGGFVANSQTSTGATGGEGPTSTVTLQIPVANFSAALEEVESFGKVSQLTTKATDVTAQYVDLQSKITALEASRQQYLTIMTKADSIGDILSVQTQLNTLQSQIQQLQGQLMVLGSETDYSTLTVRLNEPGSPPPHRRRAAALSGLSQAWHDSLHGFAAGVEGLIRVAGPALFVLLCLGALLLGGQLSWRRLQRHNL